MVKYIIEKIKKNLKRSLDKNDINIKEFEQKIKNGAVVVDVRSNLEYDEGHIDGAISLPEYDINIENTNKTLPDKNETILVYCSTGERSKKAKQNIEIYASDISAEALEIARKNAILNNEETNIRFIKSNMFENINDKFDIILSNPPYIETQTIANLSKEVQNEPHIALDGGADGLDFYRIIAKEAKKHLNRNGWILLEIGYNQKESVSNLLQEEKYENTTCIKDLNGNDRVIMSLWGQA